MWHDLAFMAADLRASHGPLDDRAAEFIGRVAMAYIATADADGGCAEVVRQGPPGFIRVIDDCHLAYPEAEPLPDGARVGILLIDLGPTDRPRAAFDILPRLKAGNSNSDYPTGRGSSC